MATLSANEKDDLLVDMLEASIKGNQSAALEQANRFNKIWQSQQEIQKEKPKQRTVGELLKEVEAVRQIRLRLKAEKAAVERAERERLQRLAREKRLNEIKGHESTLWNQIELLASEKKAKSYDKAVELIIDLRDLAARESSNGFLLKFNALKERHSTKSSFIERLKKISV